MVRLPHLLALLCVLAAALAAGCGDRSNLIPAGRASELTQQLADLQASISGGQCDGLSGRVKAFHDDATSLSGAVDKRLRTRIRQGAASLQKNAVDDCQAAADAAAQQQTDTQPSDTTPPDTKTDTQPTETQTQTETAPSDTTPPDTETTPTTPTVPPTPSSAAPGDTGGTSGDGGTVTIP